MKSKAILLALLTILIASTGLVWAASEMPATEPQAQPAEQVLETKKQSPTAAELLESMNPKPVDKDACCVADCFDAWEQCSLECGTDRDCRKGCRAERRACTRGC